MQSRLFLFDLDGTLITSFMNNPTRNYHSWQVLKNVFYKLSELRDNGHGVGIITNQGGIGLYQTIDDLERKLAAVASVLGYGYVQIFADETETIISANPLYSDTLHVWVAVGMESQRRKPSGAMIREAAGYYGYQLGNDAEVMYIGDRQEDLDAADAAGAHFMNAARFFGWDF